MLQNRYCNTHTEVKTQKLLNTLSIFQLQSGKFIFFEICNKILF